MRGPEAFDRAPNSGAIVYRGRGGWQLFARLLVWAVRNSGRPA